MPMRDPAPPSGARTQAPPPAHAVPAAQAAPRRPLDPGHLLHLQRTIGNRAVGRLLAGGGVVQAKRAYFKPEESKIGEELKTLHAMAGVLDGHTEAAHRHVVDRMKKAFDPGDSYQLKREDFPASSDRRFTDWVDKLQGSNDSLKSAATGYMIEDSVTAAVRDREGYSAQVSSGNARPDFEITDGVRWGVVDVTSSGDMGHVLDKDFSLGPYAYVVESLYPAIDFSHLDTTALAVDDSAVAAMGAVRAVRANGKLAKKLGELRNQLNLIYTAGKFLYGDAAIEASYAALQLIARITSQGPEGGLLDALEVQLTAVNRTQQVVRLESVDGIITWIQEKYGVSGPPLWK